MLNLEQGRQDEAMPSLNHSYTCIQILRQLLQPHSRSVFVTTQAEEKLFHSEVVEN